MEPKKPSESYTESVQILNRSTMNGYDRLFGGKLMEWIDVIAAVVAFLCVRGLTGCRYLASPEAKAKVVESLKTAYAEGGRTAVSNKIEKLVVSGDLSRKQAAKLHEIAQGVYDHVVEKLEAELDDTVK